MFYFLPLVLSAVSAPLQEIHVGVQGYLKYRCELIASSLIKALKGCY